MGGAMSFLKGHGKRLINRYNAQYRALTFLDKAKLPSAPRYSVPNDFPQKIDPSGNIDLHEKNLKLDEFLRDVYVRDSHTPQEKQNVSQKGSSNRPYPVYREDVGKSMFREPEEIEEGHYTLSQALEFLTNHQVDPVINNASEISKKYNIDEKHVESVLQYYSVFNVYKEGDLIKYPLLPTERPLEECEEHFEKAYEELGIAKEEEPINVENRKKYGLEQYRKNVLGQHSTRTRDNIKNNN